MKNYYLFCLLGILTLCFQSMLAQEQTPFETASPLQYRHEVNVDFPSLLFELEPSVGYEYIIKPDMGMGGRIILNLDRSKKTGVITSLQPFYRWYFSSNRRSARNVARGFFVEIDSNLSYIEGNPSPNDDEMKSVSGIAGGLGFGVGWKYVSLSGWTCDIFFGAGRNLFYPEWEGNSYYFVKGFTVGKRF